MRGRGTADLVSHRRLVWRERSLSSQVSGNIQKGREICVGSPWDWTGTGWGRVTMATKSVKPSLRIMYAQIIHCFVYPNTGERWVFGWIQKGFFSRLSVIKPPVKGCILFFLRVTTIVNKMEALLILWEKSGLELESSARTSEEREVPGWWGLL